MKKILTTIALVAIIFATLSANVNSNKDLMARKLHTYNSIVKELQTSYVDSLAVEDIMDYSISALLYKLDPYTEYYPESDQDELLALSANGYAGIGSVISKRDDNIIISGPYWDSPARKAGLRHGDVIVAVNGDTITSETDISSVSRRLRGQAGTTVRVDVARPWVGADSLMSFEIIRENIVTDVMPFAEVLPDSIGYIVLTSFSENTAGKMRDAVSSMKDFPGLKGLILDLRGNGGGLLDGAVQLANLFFPKGTEILRTRGRDGQESIYKTTVNPIAEDIPLVVLVNGGTASSSEIVAGSMQDLDRAVIMGTRTFGKGLVQSTRPLPYGDLLKVTTAKYYIPSGRLIQALNYSERNEDGTPTHTPDSLANIFHTLSGRIIRDGGGISPDIEVRPSEPSNLVQQIYGSYSLFDFVNRQYARNPEAPAVDAVLVDSTLFQEFKSFMLEDDFKYDAKTDMTIDLLDKTITSEGYMTDSVAEQISVLRTLLHHDLASDIERDREDIIELLGEVLGSRYYNDHDRYARSIPEDSVLIRARALLHKPEEYHRLLSPAQE